MTIRTLEENEIEQVAGGALATTFVASSSSLSSLASSSSFTYHPIKVLCRIGGGVGPISCMEVIPAGVVIR
ncbi:MAG TPA: hypothetical protein VIZ65_03845 [Cellvibrionaceae bacterium]